MFAKQTAFHITAIPKTLVTGQRPSIENEIFGTLLTRQNKKTSFSFTKNDSSLQLPNDSKNAGEHVRHISAFEEGPNIHFKNKIKTDSFTTHTLMTGNSISRGIISDVKHDIPVFTFKQNTGNATAYDALHKLKRYESKLFAAGGFNRSPNGFYMIGRAVLDTGQVKNVRDAQSILRSATDNHFTSGGFTLEEYMQKSRGGTLFGTMSSEGQRYIYSIFSKSLQNEKIYMVEGTATLPKWTAISMRTMTSKYDSMKIFAHFLPMIVKKIMPVVAIGSLAAIGAYCYARTDKPTAA